MNSEKLFDQKTIGQLLLLSLLYCNCCYCNYYYFQHQFCCYWYQQYRHFTATIDTETAMSEWRSISIHFEHNCCLVTIYLPPPERFKHRFRNRQSINLPVNPSIFANFFQKWFKSKNTFNNLPFSHSPIKGYKFYK